MTTFKDRTITISNRRKPSNKKVIRRTIWDSGQNCWGKAYVNKNGRYHREDGPALVLDNGYREWLLNGKTHRIDKPACYHADGRIEWCVEGGTHRVGGPAITYLDGRVEWWINNNQYFHKDEYIKDCKMTKEEEMVFILKWGSVFKFD